MARTGTPTGISGRTTADKEYGTLLKNPDWVTLARAFGIDGAVVDDVVKLPGALAEACAHDGSVLLAVPIDRMPNPF